MAPVDDGFLQRSIVASDQLGANAKKQAPRLARGQRATGINVYAGTRNPNGVPREFGTVRTPPEPFMRPAWESNKGQVLESVSEQLAVEIKKTAARAAKKKKG